MDEKEIIIFSQGIIAILTGFLVEGLKRAGLPGKYLFITSAIVGLSLGCIAAYLTPEISLSIGFFGGLFAGAIASGFYSGGKKIVRG